MLRIQSIPLKLPGTLARRNLESLLVQGLGFRVLWTMDNRNRIYFQDLPGFGLRVWGLICLPPAWRLIPACRETEDNSRSILGPLEKFNSRHFISVQEESVPE